MINRRKGFSLIELLIVIAIIGIIATIAIPILLSARAAAIREKARNSCRAAVSAEFAFYAANGVYGTAGVLADPSTSADPDIQTQDPYLDERWGAVGAGDLGNNITGSIDLPGADLFTVTVDAIIGGVTYTYEGDQTGLVEQTAP